MMSWWKQQQQQNISVVVVVLKNFLLIFYYGYVTMTLVLAIINPATVSEIEQMDTYTYLKCDY